jgi:hypothetical protein
VADLNLKPSDERYGLASISKIKDALDKLFVDVAWQHFEPETISLELKLVLDDLLLDKIQVLKILEQAPHLFFDDPTFLLYATDVINNTPANFSSVPSPVSLELAFAISEVKKILAANGQVPEFTPEFVKTIVWMLRQEGYSKPIYPFDFIPESDLERGQTAADTEAKEKAIKTYIDHMESL